MKLKAILLAGVVCLAGAVTSSAQTVFSANTVGFVNKNIPTGFSMIANPVSAADNSLDALFADVPVGTQLFLFDPVAGTYQIFEFSNPLFGGGDPAWSPNGAATLMPGQGAFISNSSGDAFTVTFAGEVQQGDASNLAIGAGFSIVSSVVAQGGAVATDLGFPSEVGDQIFQFDNGSGAYNIFEFSNPLFGGGDPAWSPSEPSVEVAESFFVNKVGATSWTRNFDPNSSNS